MLTTDVLREVWQDIVSRHKTGVSFTLETNKVLDQDPSVSYPCAAWVLPTTGLIQSNEILQETYTLNVLFVEQTDATRPAVQRDGAHARMDAVGKQCFARFFELYIQQEGTWQGQDVDLSLQGAPIFTPIFDDGVMQRTGVAMTCTIKSNAAPECVDDYFNLSA